MTNDSTDSQRRFLVDRLNDCQDLKRALRRTGPGEADTLDHLIDAFNRQLLHAAAHGTMCGIDALDADDLLTGKTALAPVIAKLEAALERLK
jgi:hypothetical protein